ncbi:S8 family serine peptidase [Herminiimonas sp. CN]|uniref:subtilisin-like serine protease QhpE n=1 Tax=Herminiimonas sp. CN TaxID=1349818 RepID=UPI0004742C07|nr:S8 family serine peptidase [Herminiimonas sp. CN]
MLVKVGIIDSGIGPGLDADVGAGVTMRLAEGGQVQCLAGDRTDSLGHGTAVASLILARAPRCSLLSAQVFYGARPAAAQVIVAAIEWCVAEGARIINLSLGLREDRRALKESCLAAISQGVLLVASHPARGEATYPAIYPGVLAVSGDIRCGEGDCASIAHDRLFGASPLPPNGFSGGGASYAAARMTGRAAAFFDACPAATVADFKNHLQTIARFHGREHRQAVS